MRWWSSKTQSVTVINIYSVAYCYVSYLALPDFLIPSITTTQVHPPTWAPPVSIPAYLTSTQGHLPSWASLVSVPAYRRPTLTSYTFWLWSYCIPISAPILLLLLASRESARVARSCFSVASWHHHAFILCPPPLRTLSPLHTPQIRDESPPAAPRFPAVALCRS